MGNAATNGTGSGGFQPPGRLSWLQKVAEDLNLPSAGVLAKALQIGILGNAATWTGSGGFQPPGRLSWLQKVAEDLNLPSAGVLAKALQIGILGNAATMTVF